MCQSEVSELNKVHDKLKDQGLVLAGIAVDAQDPDKVRNFVQDFEAHYTILLDDGRVSVAYGVIDAVPVTVVIDRQGWIVYKAQSFHSEEDLLRIVQPWL